ncbi:hypothetical protein EDD17DRAFT_1605887 [Pisolithus thermaeus]|nr:hypothetical protein EDD17DRAFT_1605887 [Pisolithus thermaeus]
MTSGLLHDPMTSAHPSSSTGPRFRPYASSKHQVTKGRYITSNDSRGYIPVYEYPLNGQWIMMDIDDGYILWTGIWKGSPHFSFIVSSHPPHTHTSYPALGNSKGEQRLLIMSLVRSGTYSVSRLPIADIVKMIDSQPDLASVIRRVRGGYLKIQGTWMPYEVALRLSRRVAWPIRDDLVPLFGPTFPATCLSPDQVGYGQIVPTAAGRRRQRRSNPLATPVFSGPQPSVSSWPGSVPAMPVPSGLHLSSASFHSSDLDAPPSLADGYTYPPHRLLQHDDGRRSPRQRVYNTTPSSSSSSPLVHERSVRYSPYPGSTAIAVRKSSTSTSDSISVDIPSLVLHDRGGPSGKLPGDQIKLPPIQPLAPPRTINNPSYALPPISALEDLRGVSSQDSAAVLERLKMDDERKVDADGDHMHWSRQRSGSVSTAISRAVYSFPTTTPNSLSEGAHGSYGRSGRLYDYPEHDGYRGRSQTFRAFAYEHTPTSSGEAGIITSQLQGSSQASEYKPTPRPSSHGTDSNKSAGRSSSPSLSLPMAPTPPSRACRDENDSPGSSRRPMRPW